MSNRDMSETTMALLGKLLGPEVTGRDAIHIAVVPVTAAERLRPGEHVGLVDEGTVSNDAEPWIGIVDPYLPTAVRKGQRFFLHLYPRTITSLRHEWTHPAFETAAPVATISQSDHVTKSRAWIAEHAHALGLSDDVLMENAADWLRYEDHIIQQGSERWRDTFNPTEFWHHYEIVTGEVVPQDKKHSFYCCTC